MIMSLKQRKIKFEAGIKLNHNNYIVVIHPTSYHNNMKINTIVKCHLFELCVQDLIQERLSLQWSFLY